MSEHGFHVHGAHEHALEHHAQGGGLAQAIAIFTAILATLGAVVSYQGGATQNEAMLLKNDAILKKSEATDQWGLYQAKSSKGHLMELAVDIAPKEKADFYRAQIAKYEQEKQVAKHKAEELDKESQLANEKSDQALHPHHRLALAMTLLQIAISLASITALTQRRWLFACAGVAAAGGVALTVMGLLG